MKKFNHNGRLISRGEGLINFENRAFRYGDGLFETMRGTDGDIPLWKYHLERLTDGMRVLGYEGDASVWSGEFFRGEIAKIQPTSGQFKIRLLIYRQDGGTYAPPNDGFNFLLEVHPLSEATADGAIRLGIYREISLHPTPLSPFKTMNALVYVHAARYARQRGWDEVLLFNRFNRPVEATSYGLVLRFGNKLIAAPDTEGGVRSTYVRYLTDVGAREMGCRFQYRRLKIDDLHTADRIYLVNAVRGMREAMLVDVEDC